MTVEIDLNTVKELPKSVQETVDEISSRCAVALAYIAKRREHEKKEFEEERKRFDSLPWFKRIVTSSPSYFTYACWSDDYIEELRISCKLQMDFHSRGFHRLLDVERDMKELPL